MLCTDILAARRVASPLDVARWRAKLRGVSEPVQRALATRGHTRRLGQALARALRAGDLVVLEGDLGAGKTFLIRVIARALGVPTSIPITSPTFTLAHELPGRLPILHCDLYRLDDPDELWQLGLLEQIGGEGVVLVEWGERFLDALGGEGLLIRLDLRPEGGRAAVLEPQGAAGCALLERWRAEERRGTVPR